MPNDKPVTATLEVACPGAFDVFTSSVPRYTLTSYPVALATGVQFAVKPLAVIFVATPTTGGKRPKVVNAADSAEGSEFE